MLAQQPSGPLPESVPNTSIVLVSGYVVPSNGTSGAVRAAMQSEPTRNLLSCLRGIMRDALAHLVETSDGVQTLNLAHIPAAATLDREWKKLAGIIAAAEMGAELIIWHDGDAVPHPQGELIARARLVAAAQSDTDFWVPPGEPALYSLPLMSRADDFWGDSMATIKKSRIRLHSISMHTGVILMRSGPGKRMAEGVIARYYDANASSAGAGALINFMVRQRGLPRDFYGGGELTSGETTPLWWHPQSDTANSG